MEWDEAGQALAQAQRQVLKRPIDSEAAQKASEVRTEPLRLIVGGGVEVATKAAQGQRGESSAAATLQSQRHHKSPQSPQNASLSDVIFS